MRYEKQGRVNSLNPTKSGVISSPDPRQQAEIQRLHSPDFNLRNVMPKAATVDVLSDDKDDAEINSSNAGSEDFVTEESERHQVAVDDTVNNVHHR